MQFIVIDEKLIMISKFTKKDAGISKNWRVMTMNGFMLQHFRMQW